MIYKPGDLHLMIEFSSIWTLEHINVERSKRNLLAYATHYPRKTVPYEVDLSCIVIDENSERLIVLLSNVKVGWLEIKDVLHQIRHNNKW